MSDASEVKRWRVKYMYVYEVKPMNPLEHEKGQGKVRIFIPLAHGKWESWFDYCVENGLPPSETTKSCFSYIRPMSLRELKERARRFDDNEGWQARLLGKVPL